MGYMWAIYLTTLRALTTSLSIPPLKFFIAYSIVYIRLSSIADRGVNTCRHLELMTLVGTWLMNSGASAASLPSMTSSSRGHTIISFIITCISFDTSCHSRVSVDGLQWRSPTRVQRVLATHSIVGACSALQ